jgi:preprotein translocase subunit SecG
MSSIVQPGDDAGWRSAARSMILFVSLLMTVWGIATWLRRSGYDASVGAVFGADPDSDQTVGFLEVLYRAVALLSLAFAGLFLVLGLSAGRARAWARILVIVGTAPAVLFVLAAYVDAGRSYLLGVGANSIAENARVNTLTPWRFSGGYHAMSTVFGVAIIVCLGLSVLMLVRKPTPKADLTASEAAQSARRRKC